ncbi:MAG: hypothetical protein A2140_08695 [Candidatus Muproteobacteria bacterium RBG_16_62_13]|uniref:PA2779 family protein n=1 Tax=Candidatus Muproteobacteria bacterium RBG_16_62_13 TaxID=1817756 RepID=A0A1F6T5T3_9PROT|nr:MAG: hypothetical protein A2140_08695 [Candidatus Muproteobacteria bacterium RBG_16_62_13]
MFRRLAKPVSYALITGVLALSLHGPAARAAMVTTDQIVSAQQSQQDRAKVHTLLAREDVKQALSARGVSTTDIQARVEAMTDQEVQALSSKLDRLPAGGDALGVLALIFIILLITDALGITDIFPFVKKPARR